MSRQHKAAKSCPKRNKCNPHTTAVSVLVSLSSGPRVTKVARKLNGRTVVHVQPMQVTILPTNQEDILLIIIGCPIINAH